MLKVPREYDEARGMIYKTLNQITLFSSFYVLIPIILYPLLLWLGSILWNIFYFDEEIGLLFAFLKI